VEGLAGNVRFARALNEVIEAVAGFHNADLARHLGKNPSRVTRLRYGEELVKLVAALDQLALLDAYFKKRPGFFLRAMGYVEDAEGVVAAVESDPDLDPPAQRALLDAYDQAVSAAARRRLAAAGRGRPPKGGERAKRLHTRVDKRTPPPEAGPST
jgi:hypothetical protein